MVTLSPDTSPYIEQMQIELLRHMPAWRKLALVGEMNRVVRDLALVGLRQRHPHDTPAQRLRLRFLADECCDAAPVDALRDDGHDVLHAAESLRGATDDNIIRPLI